MNQQYYATEDGVLYRKYDYSIIPLEKDRAHKYNNYVRFTTAGGGKVYYRAQHVLVWSYHGNVYNIEERASLDVMHNNRRMFDFSSAIGSPSLRGRRSVITLYGACHRSTEKNFDSC